MESERFDAVVRALSAGASRRGVLGFLAAAGAGVLGQRAVVADTCKRNGKPCKKHAQCCSGNCVPDPARSGPLNGTCQPACLARNQACPPAGGTCCDPGYFCSGNECFGETITCCGTQDAPCLSNCDCCGILNCIQQRPGDPESAVCDSGPPQVATAAHTSLG